VESIGTEYNNCHEYLQQTVYDTLSPRYCIIYYCNNNKIYYVIILYENSQHIYACTVRVGIWYTILLCTVHITEVHTRTHKRSSSLKIGLE